MHSKLLIPLALVTVITGGLSYTASRASAHDSWVRRPLVTRIAEKFNLKEDDVKAVFEEEHAAREAEMKAAVEEKLATAVQEGKITEAQKAAIIAKLQEMHDSRQNHESFKDMTKEERRAAMESKRSDMQKWAEDNGLTIDMVHDIAGFGGKGHFIMKIAK